MCNVIYVFYFRLCLKSINMFNGLYLIYVICVCLRIVVSNTYCVFALLVFVLCTLCFQSLWIVNFDCPSVFSNVYRNNKFRFIFDRCFFFLYIHKSIINIMKLNFFCIFTEDMTLSLNVFRQAITLVINYKENTLLQI